MTNFAKSLLTQRHFFQPETFIPGHKSEHNRFATFVESLIEDVTKKIIKQRDVYEVVSPIFGSFSKEICERVYLEIGRNGREDGEDFEKYIRNIIEEVIQEQFAKFRYELSLLCSAFTETYGAILLDSLAFTDIPLPFKTSNKERPPFAIRGMDAIFNKATKCSCPVWIDSDIVVNRGYRFPFYKIYNGTGAGVFECAAISYFPRLVNGEGGVFLPHLEYGAILFEQRFLSSLTGNIYDSFNFFLEGIGIFDANPNLIQHDTLVEQYFWDEDKLPHTSEDKILDGTDDFQSMFGKSLVNVKMLNKLSIPLHGISKNIDANSQLLPKDCLARTQLISLAEERLEEYQAKSMRSARKHINDIRKARNNLSVLTRF